jgi:Cu/Ag efflux protein CusF
MLRRLTLAAGLALGAAVALAQGGAQPTAGEITKLDAAQQRLTIKHGEIKNLDMPPMTMVFRVKEAKMLEGLKAGDRVRFTAAKIDGHYTVTSIAKAP